MTQAEANALEAEKIREYQSDNPEHGYNRTATGQGKKPLLTMGTAGPDAEIMVYRSLTRAAEDTGADIGNIHRAATGKRHTAGGLEWVILRPAGNFKEDE